MLGYDSHISMLSEMSIMNCILCNTPSHNVGYANGTTSSTGYCTYDLISSKSWRYKCLSMLPRSKWFPFLRHCLFPTNCLYRFTENNSFSIRTSIECLCSIKFKNKIVMATGIKCVHGFNSMDLQSFRFVWSEPLLTVQSVNRRDQQWFPNMA